MDEYRFYKNTISMLDVLSKGSFQWLVEDGWITEDDADRILIVLQKLNYAKLDSENNINISEKGQRVISSLQEGAGLPEIEQIIQAIDNS
jgi:hypothetical protein